MDDYPLLNIFLTMMYFFLWIMLFFLLFRILTDVFRDHSMSGWAKAGWIVLVILLPFIGALIYLIARGPSMARRDNERLKRQEETFRAYVKGAAGQESDIDQLEKLARMKEKGTLTDEEFDLAKSKLLGQLT